MTTLPRNTILVGDVRERLHDLPDHSVDCIITSPPYFNARDYGHERQLGLEPTVERWVAELRAVCQELARVLAPQGALWLNLGDAFAQRRSEGAARKSLLLAPERLALALTADGWLLRNKVIWAKSNPMPNSVRDRLTLTYEVVYFLTRSTDYRFDLDAIRQPLRTIQRQTTRDAGRQYPPPEAHPTSRSRNPNTGLSRLKATGHAGHPLGKNPGDVWTFATANFHGAHFAVFPPALVERPLLATCPRRVCVQCGQSAAPKTCACAARTRPGLVLDPFMGAGTTALVAERHGRNWLGIELNPAYAELATQRIERRPTAEASETKNERR